MPVKKTEKNKKEASKERSGFCQLGNSESMSFCRILYYTLGAILVVYLIVLLGVLIRNQMQEFKFIGQADKQERTISIQGQGKVTARPDVAVTTMGMIAEGETVAEAQEQNTEVMNNLIDRLKSLGITEEDIQTTNYNIYPRYDYTEEKGRELSGYQVSQNVTIKIKDLSKANQILALAGEVGANTVSGLEFTIDDKEKYKNQARMKALSDAGEKARFLSRVLGVNMVSVVSYNEHEQGEAQPELYRSMAVDGLGGGAEPQIESGSEEVIMNVNIVFEIRS